MLQALKPLWLIQLFQSFHIPFHHFRLLTFLAPSVRPLLASLLANGVVFVQPWIAIKWSPSAQMVFYRDGKEDNEDVLYVKGLHQGCVNAPQESCNFLTKPRREEIICRTVYYTCCPHLRIQG